MSLWTAQEVATATGGQLSDKPPSGDFAADGVSIDSRSLAEGDLFIALQGPNFDGHRFVDAAFAAGAAGALVAQASAAAKRVVVGDTQDALTALGRAARARSRARIIAVTGSVGKTGTKEALRLALSDQGLTHASAGSLNNHWGAPLSLARMPREAAFGVFELGMNHPGELAALSPIARPHVAVITTVEPAHLGNFASIEAIADAKAEIFAGVEPGGAAVLNRDNPHYARLAAAARRRGITRVISFGEHGDAAIRMLDARLGPSASVVKASVLGQIVDYRVALPGRHWVMNSLAVLGAVKAVGGDVDAAAAALSRLAGIAGRGRRHRIALAAGAIDLIDESYNASPASMRAALAVLGAAELGAGELETGGRRIAVLGAMLELGDQSAALHAALAEPLTANRIDLVFTVGGAMERLRDALPAAMRGAHAATASELAAVLKDALRPGDVVTVKGSAGSRMGEIVRSLLAGAPAQAPSAAAE
jgi:UDP-N-acetylmuramoyl-tripeptide--D-alanyl-D-alanine ligase